MKDGLKLRMCNVAITLENFEVKNHKFAKRLSDVCESTQHICELTVGETTGFHNSYLEDVTQCQQCFVFFFSKINLVVHFE